MSGQRLPRGARAIAEKVEPHGWTWEKTGSNHLRWRGPNGGVVFTGFTSSDHRAIKNALRDFKRQGCPL